MQGDESLVLRLGAFGTRTVVLMVERAAEPAAVNAVEAASFFGEGGERGWHDPYMLPWDELRNASKFDSRLPETRTARRPFAHANGSSTMADLLLGGCEDGELTGKSAPPVGTHAILRDGGTSELSGGIADLARGVQPTMAARGAAAPPLRWRPMLVQPLSEPPGARLRAEEVLRRFDAALALLRNRAALASFRTGHAPSRGAEYEYAIADVEGGASVVEQLLVAMCEACDGLGYALGLEPPEDELGDESFLVSMHKRGSAGLG